MRNSENGVVRFGEFALDLSGRCLRRNGQRVRLTPKPFETLAFLVEHPHQTVAKQRLLDGVWKDAAVTEGALVQAIREVRRALDDDDKEPRYIQTIPRTGYRFIASIVPDTPPVGDLKPSDVVRHVRPGRNRMAVAFSAIVVVAVAGLVWRFARPVANAAPAELLEGRPVHQLTSGTANAVKPSFSPDGKAILFLSPATNSGGDLDLFVMPAGGGTPRRLTEGVVASGDLPVFTPDGSRIVFSRFRSGADGTRLPDLWTVGVAGGTPTRLLEDASGAGFSPDGTRMAYTKSIAGRRSLWVSPVDRLDEHRELAVRGFVPRWSSDGRWIAYTTSDPQGGSGHLWIVPASSGEPVQLTAEAEDVYGLTWTANSQAIIMASDRAGEGVQLRQVPLSGGPARTMTAGVGYYVSPSVSPDGETVVFSYLNPFPTLAVSDSLANPAVRHLGRGDHHLGHLWPRLSPSATRIASVGRLLEGERLWITDVATGARVSMSDRLAANPSWLDDNRVAYLSRREGSNEKTSVYIMDVGSGKSSIWTEMDGDAASLAVHPSETKLAFVSRLPEGDQRIMLRDLKTDVEHVIATGGRYEALRWRPDGSMLAWSGPGAGGNIASNGIWVVEPGRSGPRQLVKDGYAPVWSADGGTVYFSRPWDDHGDSGLWRFDLAQGRATRVRSWGHLTYYDVVGDHLVVAANEASSHVFAMRIGQ